MTLLTGAIIATACDPIEDEDLRDKYFTNPGTPITKAELQAAISVTQPIPNTDGAIEGDQYVHIKNSRPDIGGVWHIKPQGKAELTVVTDNDTIVLTENLDYQIYYVGISANQIIITDPVSITVTNVFDEWSNFLTGAEDKADKSAQKTWKFRESYKNIVAGFGAHGAWRYYNPIETCSALYWWGQVSPAQVGDQKMVFDFNGNKMTTYDTSGNKAAEGFFSFNHDAVEEGVLGEFTTTIPTIGASFDYNGQKTDSQNPNKFWLLTLSPEYLTIYHPGKYTGGVDWENEGWYAFFESENLK